jgi:ubiquinone/menaquinone biosynthesis C-methylase UbiE
LEDSLRKLTERYDREARAYRDLWAPILQGAGLRLLREVAGESARRILDVGAGVGSLLPSLRTTFPGALVVGVDRSRGMLALAPREFPRVVMAATALGIPDACVDLVLFAFILFHLESPLDGLREARRVLRPGGIVASATWAEEMQSAATRLWSACLDAHGAAPADPATSTRHDLVDSPEKTGALYRAAGFRAVRSWSEDLVSTIDRERLVGLRTSMGSAKPRFDSLGPEAQAACIAAARARLEALSPEAFVARGRIVYSVARA